MAGRRNIYTFKIPDPNSRPLRF